MYVQSSNPLLIVASYRVIRKRVVWLMGQWVGVKMSVQLRPVLYEAVLGLLDPEEDMAVRLEAAQTLKTDILWWGVDDIQYCLLLPFFVFFSFVYVF